MSVTPEMLRNNILFEKLHDEEMERLTKLIFARTYKSGRTLFFENTPGEVMYLIHSGTVGIFKSSGDKNELQLATLGPGSFFGEMSLLDDRPRSATARVMDDAELVVITKKAFEQMLETDPGITSKILIAMLKAVFQRLRDTDERFKSLMA